jgi:gelsolin
MAGQAKLEDSNISNYGSKEHKDLKLAAAQSEKAWADAGKKPGVQIWRIEKFQVVPKTAPAEFGKFYSGDSYIVLHTYRAKDAEGKLLDKLLYNVHFWLGSKSTQDEMGTAAYKTVELDDLLGDLPVQFREVQGYESEEFLQLFEGKITILEGGMDSGFNHVKPEAYTPRLLHMKGQKQIRVTEVKLEWKSLNNGDVFLLDAGLELFQWNGKTAGIHEKRKASEIIENLKKERNGRPKAVVLDDLEANEKFWKLLGGKPAAGQIGAATSDDVKFEKCKKLIELSDKTGKLVRTVVAEGAAAKKAKLNTKEVFLLDLGHVIYSWIGKGASPAERKNGIKAGVDYLAENHRPAHTPVVRVLEGAEQHGFLDALK